MGQARQRKLAKAAGRPWPEDAPSPAKPQLWYMPGVEMSPAYPIAMVNPPLVESPVVERMREIARQEKPRVLVIGDDPRGQPVRRRGGVELAFMMAAMSLDGPLVVKSPKR
jgi:hypothetical protein